MKTNSIMTVALLSLALNLQAQELIELSGDEIVSLGIEFSQVDAINAQSGTQFPAIVVNSPNTVSTLTARFSGIVEQWYVELGATVESDQVIASIRSQNVMEIQNKWRLASSALAQAELDLARDKDLLAAGIISQIRLQQTQTVYDQSLIEANLTAEQLAWAGYPKRASDTIQEGVNETGLYLLRAPVSGVMAQRTANVGDYINVNSVIATLNRDSLGWLQAKLPAHIAALLPIGHPLMISGSGETLILKQKDLAVDVTTQTVNIFAQFTDPVNYMTGRVLTLLLPPLQQGLLVPASAVVHSVDETTLYVQIPTGVEARTLPMQAIGADYLVTDGLQIGDLVVTQGASVLKGIQLGLGSE